MSMKRSLLVVAAGVLGTFAAAAQAQTWSFSSCSTTGPTGPSQAACDSAYSGNPAVTVAGGIQSWTVPTTGEYRITAIGAKGAAASLSFTGGYGARVSATFTLTAGTILKIAVGQPGVAPFAAASGGGGGGSFVTNAANTPLVVAGGGGGTRIGARQDGCNASLTTFAIQGSADQSTSTCPVKAVGEGQGGVLSSDDAYGAAGGGFYSNGANDASYGLGGSSWANGVTGGLATAACEDGLLSHGGFGAGGSGNGCDGGGGGGGYSGGDGGWVAGGGGSYNAGSAPTAAVTTSTFGEVIIQFGGAPTPVTVATPVPTLGERALPLLALVIGGLAMAAVRRRASH